MSKIQSRLGVRLVLSVTAVALMSRAVADAEPTTRPAADRASVARAIASAAQSGDVTALTDVRGALDGTFSGERLESALAETDLTQRNAALERLADDLAFEPTSEAPTPEGWPSFTPIGEIELKTYPGYRSAVTGRVDALPDSLMFWKLFLYIQRNKISMTAPVEMTMDGPAEQEMQSMGFLFETEEVGKLGTQGAVSVVDVPPQLAVSIGLRGEMDKAAIAEAAGRIDQWIADRAGDYEPAGEIRVLGYNSPSMPEENKYYEVQRVVTKKEAGK